jgi:murein DD-endopeptidase MepM/ murein hydrolase activator NlpD
VNGAYSFGNSWGAARSGGRTYTACDILAARGTPCVACVSGTISRVNATDTGLGGITIWLGGYNGYSYYYAHLETIALGVQVGTSARAERTVAYVGSTGNAGGCNHLHFAMYPGGGVAVNPYATLRFYD